MLRTVSHNKLFGMLIKSIKKHQKTIAQQIIGDDVFYLQYDFEQRIHRRKSHYIDKQISIENIKIIKAIFDLYKIKYWLLFGTLLGAIRDNDFLDHDTDTDLGTFISEKPKIIAAIPDLQKRGFEVIRTKHPDDLVTFMRKDEYIDVGIFKKTRDIFLKPCWKYQSNRVYGDHFDGFVSISFLSQSFLIPKNVEQLLEQWYGSTWKMPQIDRPASSPISHPLIWKYIQITILPYKIFKKAYKFFLTL